MEKSEILCLQSYKESITFINKSVSKMQLVRIIDKENNLLVVQTESFIFIV